tara:strand:- start:31 stop:975 length:945 start_codon:yes stop_codon:yes gene_type:complete
MSTGKGVAKKNKNSSYAKSTLSDINPAWQKPSVQKPLKGLAIVATPIGNSRDITLRALDILHEANTIACEDTRITTKLLNLYGISKPLTSYHEHNADKVRPKLIKHLKEGKTIALVSDAGTPLISDPGYKLVLACIKEKIPITPIPGPSSVLTSLMISGLPTDQFFFAGFLSSKATARKKALRSLANIPATLVIMESAKRISKSLTDMAEILGPRPTLVARELTKLFEELKNGLLPDLASHYKLEGPPKGEITIVIGPPLKKLISDKELNNQLLRALQNNSVRDATNLVCKESNLPRRKVYTHALKLKKLNNGS